MSNDLTLEWIGFNDFEKLKRILEELKKVERHSSYSLPPPLSENTLKCLEHFQNTMIIFGFMTKHYTLTRTNDICRFLELVIEFKERISTIPFFWKLLNTHEFWQKVQPSQIADQEELLYILRKYLEKIERTFSKDVKERSMTALNFFDSLDGEYSTLLDYIHKDIMDHFDDEFKIIYEEYVTNKLGHLVSRNPNTVYEFLEKKITPNEFERCFQEKNPRRGRKQLVRLNYPQPPKEIQVKHKIFISYSHEPSATVAITLYIELLSRGITWIWFDQSFLRMHRIYREMWYGVKECDVFVCFISNNYSQQFACCLELFAFWYFHRDDKKKKIIFLFPEDEFVDPDTFFTNVFNAIIAPSKKENFLILFKLVQESESEKEKKTVHVEADDEERGQCNVKTPIEFQDFLTFLQIKLRSTYQSIKLFISKNVEEFQKNASPQLIEKDLELGLLNQTALTSTIETCQTEEIFPNLAEPDNVVLTQKIFNLFQEEWKEYFKKDELKGNKEKVEFKEYVKNEEFAMFNKECHSTERENMLRKIYSGWGWRKEIPAELEFIQFDKPQILLVGGSEMFPSNIYGTSQCELLAVHFNYIGIGARVIHPNYDHDFLFNENQNLKLLIVIITQNVTTESHVNEAISKAREKEIKIQTIYERRINNGAILNNNGNIDMSQLCSQASGLSDDIQLVFKQQHHPLENERDLTVVQSICDAIIITFNSSLSSKNSKRETAEEFYQEFREESDFKKEQFDTYRSVIKLKKRDSTTAIYKRHSLYNSFVEPNRHLRFGIFFCEKATPKRSEYSTMLLPYSPETDLTDENSSPDNLIFSIGAQWFTRFRWILLLFSCLNFLISLFYWRRCFQIMVCLDKYVALISLVRLLLLIIRKGANPQQYLDFLGYFLSISFSSIVSLFILFFVSFQEMNYLLIGTFTITLIDWIFGDYPAHYLLFPSLNSYSFSMFQIREILFREKCFQFLFCLLTMVIIVLYFIFMFVFKLVNPVKMDFLNAMRPLQLIFIWIIMTILLHDFLALVTQFKNYQSNPEYDWKLDKTMWGNRYKISTKKEKQEEENKSGKSKQKTKIENENQNAG